MKTTLAGQLTPAAFDQLTRNNFRWRAESCDWAEYAVDATGETLTSLPAGDDLIEWRPIAELPDRHWSDMAMGIVVRRRIGHYWAG